MEVNHKKVWSYKWRRIGNGFAITLGCIIILLMIGLLSFRWSINYIWLDSLQFGSIFITIIKSKILLGFIGFFLFFISAYFTLAWIRKTYLAYFHDERLPALIKNHKESRLLLFGISFLVGTVGSMIVQGIGWEPLLKAIYHSAFGISDPYFKLDLSFYMFILPMLEIGIYVLLGLSLFYLVIEISFYSFFQLYQKSRLAQLHLGFTLAIVGLLLAALHAIKPFHTLLTNKVNMFQESVVHGLSYTDRFVNIPAAYILAGMALLGSIWMIIELYRKNYYRMIIPIVMYVIFVITAQFVSVGVQQFIVSPNEFSKEAPYLEHNLNYTRAAYQLDEVKEKEHPASETLNQEMLTRNKLTLDNVRINDSRPLLEIYNQLQTFRTYYQFQNIDIDRYMIDGAYQQVFIGARELNTVKLPSQAKTWVNEKLRYTHGYGIAMSQVNKITKQGQPKYLMKNIPPEGALDINKPQIYFGEENYNNVIVNSKVDEFDYPSGDENMSTRFEGNSGIPLTGLKRLLFALNEGSFRMLISDQINKDSQLLDTRNIMERVRRIAPFFQYDDDPYIFIREDGSLAWLIDAYVTTDGYPFAEPYAGKNNYIRNSVKVVVDAYTGKVNFYIAEADDPLLKTYANIFPELFTKDIPADIRSHFRYPEKLFTIQAKMYGTYHMENLEVFYNREDFWEFPTEKYYNEDIEMEPYYVTMKLPEYDNEEFMLIMPYTPKKRQNMIAWMGVRNDGNNYGEKVVYRFPKQKNIYGPQQIENRINQDSRISQQLNLWSQGGSEVIRGNLLAIPIEDTMLYVEPIYIESANETSLPEVKQIVMAYGDHIVMEATFEEALDQILQYIDPKRGAEKENNEKDPKKQEVEEGKLPKSDSEKLLQEIAAMFETYQKELSAGNWEKAAKIMTEIETKLKDVE